MKLIDTHQHLIYREHFGYCWTNEVPALASGDFTHPDYRHLAGDQVSASIFMESGVDDSDYQREARYVAELIRDPSNCLLGQIASCRPELDDGFDEWLEEGRSLGVVGYRRILHVVPNDTSLSETFRGNVRKIGASGLTFDICVLESQLPLALELARACDEMTLVLDHCGVPDIARGSFQLWSENIDHIAELEHVVCKLSGLPSYCSIDADQEQAARPYVDHVLECFGPHRVVWGSDWPVVNTLSSLRAWVELTLRLLDRLTRDEVASIAYRNPRRVYGIA